MKKLIFISVLVATILAGGVLAYSIWNATPLTAQAFFDSGKQFYEAKKYPEATIQLLNAVRKDDKHRNARHLLALTYIAQQDYGSGAKQLQSLLEYYPDDVEANLLLGNLYLTGGSTNPDLFREAQKLAGIILAKDPNHVGGLILSGNASAGMRNYEASEDLLKKATDLDPNNLSAFVSLGTTRTFQKKYPEAEQAFLKARQVDPKDRNALVSLGNYYRAVGDSAKAEAIFKEALVVFPTDRDIYLQVVVFYVQSGRFQEAETILKDLQGKLKDDPTPSLILAELLVKQTHTADARKLLLNLKEQYPKNVDVAVKLALNLLQDQPERARKEVDQIILDAPSNPIGHVLLGELQFFAGQHEAAQATLEKNPAIDGPYPQAHYFLGNIAIKKGSIDQAIFHYQKALAVQSAYVPARVALGELYLTQGKTADAKEELRKALEVSPDFVPARLLKAAVDRGDKNYTRAEDELNRLAKEMPENSFIHRQMAQYNESRGRSAEAEKNLARAQELEPESPEVFRELVLLYIRSKQTDKALQKINTIPDEKKKAVHYELAGLAYSQAGKNAEAERSFKKALELDPSLMSSNAYLFAGYMKSGDVAQGMKALDAAIAQSPNNASVYATKGLVYEGQGNLVEAKKYYNEALKIDPNAPVPANNLAWILAEEGSDLTTAQTLAQTARKKDPENPNIADTLGWVYYKLGNHALAREQLRFALSKQPNNPSFQYHMGLIHKGAGQIAEAKSALERSIASKTDFKERSLAQSALKELANAK